MKINRCVIAVWLVLAINSFGQVDSVKAGKWLIGISFSPEYCHRFVINTLERSPFNSYEELGEVPKFGYTAGIGLKRKLSKRIWVETGLFYTNKGVLVEFNYGYAGFDPVYLMTLPDYKRYFKSYNYVEIPLKFNFHFRPEKKVNQYISLGCAVELLLDAKSRIITEYNNDRIERSHEKIDKENITPTNIGVCVGYGWAIAVHKHFLCIVEPNYTQFAFRQFIDRPLDEYLFSFGLKAGVYYRF